jgi:hypothetical protein
MNEKVQADLWNHYHGLVEVAEETIEKLGKEEAWSFVDLANDWLDISGALSDSYRRDDLFNSLVHADFTGLFQLVRWQQLHFLAGNYAALYRDLRFAWEVMLRAYFADMYSELKPGRNDGPEATVDAKIAWLENRYVNWRDTLEPTLWHVFPPAASDMEVRDYFRGLWGKLNRYVHPSQEFRYRMIGERPLLLTDGFDETWAKEGLSVTSDVFDLIWLTVLGRFPASATLVSVANTFRLCPLTKAMVQSMHEP